MQATELVPERDRVLVTGERLSELRERLDREYRVGIHRVDLANELDEPEPIVSMSGLTVLSRGNLSAVVGEAKSKKTFLCSAMVGGLLSAAGYLGFDAREKQVLWVDTEQSEAHVQRTQKRVHIISCMDCTQNSDNLQVLTLRELEPKARMGIVLDAIELYRPDLVVIDGVADLQYNTNDLEESEHLVNKLMSLSTEYRNHILCVLHTNPNSDKARGHIGSALQRKSETVFYVHRVGPVTVVDPQFCRNEPFDRFAFKIDRDALPVLCDLPAQTSAQDICVRILRDEFGGASERSLLIDKVMQSEGCSINLARVRVTRAIQRGLIRQSEDCREVML